jgi:hypothetical protein
LKLAMQIHKVPDELKTLWNMGLVHITTHNLKRGVGDLRNSTKYKKNRGFASGFVNY